MEDGGERNSYQRHYRRYDHTPPSSPDDISVFIRQLLLRSSSSPSMAGDDSSAFSPAIPRRLRGVSAGKGAVFTDSGDGFLSSVSGAPAGVGFSGNVGSGAGNAPSCSVGASGNETDHEYDCESEEGLETMVEEGQTKNVYQRNSSKRTRAAEVHNMSEKRRRSRINEKMKALQNLIPNSNKTDKASMLDEAIEYLKQLQLQVRMLSMRNGLSLHPLSLPGMLQLSQTRMVIGDENHPSFHMSLPNIPPSSQEAPLQNAFRLPNHPSLPVMSNIIQPETSFGLDSHFRSFQLQTPPEGRHVITSNPLAIGSALCDRCNVFLRGDSDMFEIV